jgi:hypothetical protein
MYSTTDVGHLFVYNLCIVTQTLAFFLCTMYVIVFLATNVGCSGVSHLPTVFFSLVLFAAMSVINSPAFAGIHQAMKLAHTGQASDEVQDDMDGEQEGLPDVMPEDLAITAELESLQSTILNASKGVTELTDKQYHRCVTLCPQPATR